MVDIKETISSLIMHLICSLVKRRMYISCFFSNATLISCRGIFLPHISTLLNSTFPSFVFVDLVIWKGANGSPMFNSPDSITFFFPP